MEQGKFLRSRRLAELNMKLSDKVTPRDGSCMFHAILDQILNIPSLQDYASSHFELRWKIVSDGYKSFLETDKLEWPNDPMCGSKRKWKTEMLDPTTWGDEVVLSLASNLLEVDIIIIPAFRESGDQVSGVTTVKPLIHAKHQSIHLFHFSECDFISPHYESVFPRSDDDLEVSIPPSFEVREEISIMTEEDLRNCQSILDDQSIRDIQVVVSTDTDNSR